MGDRYQRVLAFSADGGIDDYAAPDLHERTLGDLIAPTRPGRMVDVVNMVRREVPGDPTAWSVYEFLSMVAMLERERQQADASGEG